MLRLFAPGRFCPGAKTSLFDSGDLNAFCPFSFPPALAILHSKSYFGVDDLVCDKSKPYRIMGNGTPASACVLFQAVLRASVIRRMVCCQRLHAGDMHHNDCWQPGENK